ncbi:hypothetical protein LINPERHAP1_LOCUS484 [Linum perenne]
MNISVCSIMRAEIHDALEGIRHACRAGCRKLEIQLDSNAVVAILTDKIPTLSHHHALEVPEFQEWLRRDWVILLKHMYWETNHTVDYLANLWTPCCTWDPNSG